MSKWIRQIERRIGRGLFVLFLAWASSSMVPVDDFVRSGDYVRARDAVADCDVSFFPALDPADREPILLASLIPIMPAGRELRYNYRPLSVEKSEIRTPSPFPGVEEDRGDAVVEMYRAPDASTAINSVRAWSDQGACTRFYIKADPPVLQVGLPESVVRTTDRFLEEFSDLIPSGYSSSVTHSAVEPGEGDIVIKLYENGNPSSGQDVYLWTDPRGDPEPYGKTLGHEHIALRTTALRPSIRIRGQRVNGDEVRARSNSEGEFRFWIRAGYRGGPESVLARWERMCDSQSAFCNRYVTVVVRHGEFKHFASALGLSEWPEPGPEFPFILTGWTERHYYNHWLDGAKAAQIVSAFRRIWDQDEGRLADGQPHFIVLNDMSLEYGGTFKIQDGDTGLDPSSGPHYTHDRGLDFDVSPCYSIGAAKVFADDCENGNHVKIDERLLTAHVIGRFGGAILEHSRARDGTPYHYHIRFPE